jgi:hypothetical protein
MLSTIKAAAKAAAIALSIATALIADQLHIVVLRQDADAHQTLVDAAALGARLERQYAVFPGFAARLDPRPASQLASDPRVAAVFPVDSTDALDQLDPQPTRPVVVEGLGDNEPLRRLVDRICDERGLAVVSRHGSNTLRRDAPGATALQARARSMLDASDSAVREDSVPAGGYRLYRVRSGGRFALAWNTHFGDGLEPSVARLAASRHGDVVAVTGDPDAAESFVLAVEGPQIEPMAGPDLRLRCGSGQCEVRNDGDLAAFDLRTTGDDPVPLGSLEPGQERVFSPPEVGTIESFSYGQRFVATYEGGGLQACLGGTSVSPPTATYSNAAGTGRFGVTAPFGCTWRTVLASGMWGWLTKYDDVLGREVRYSFGNNSGTAARTETLVVQIWNGATWTNTGASHRVTQNRPSNKITVLWPNGGEVLVAGNSYTVRWSAEGSVGPTARVEFLAGSSAVLIGSAPSAQGSLAWTVPQSLAGQANLRVRVSGTVADTSDGGFSVRSKPLRVVTPNSGVFLRGNPMPVAIEGPAGAAVKVELVQQAVTSIQPALRLDANGAGSIQWLVPLTLPEGKFRIRATSGTEVTNGGEGEVKKVPVEVTVSPNPVEERKPITVTVKAAQGEKVRLSVVTGSGSVELPGEYAAGQHAVAVPIPVGRGYKVQAVSTSDATNKGLSNAFDVAAAPPPPPPVHPVPPQPPAVAPGSKGLIVEVKGSKVRVTRDSQVYKELVARYGDPARSLLDSMIASTRFEYPYEVTLRRTEQSLTNMVSLRIHQIWAAEYLAANKPAFANGALDPRSRKTVIATAPATSPPATPLWVPERNPGAWIGIEVGRGKKPSDAMNQFFDPSRTREFSVDCYVAQLGAYRGGELAYLSADRFDRQFAGKPLKLTVTGEYSYTTKAFEALPGDGISYKDWSVPPNERATSARFNYNLLMLGPDRFYGHPDGVMTDAQLRALGYTFDASAVLRWPVPADATRPEWQRD